MATIENPTTARTPNGQVTLGAPSAAVYEDTAPRGAGWIVFSSIVLGLMGVFTFIEGILAISSSKIYAANATYVFSDLHTWGWIVAILGGLAILAAFTLYLGSEFARWYGIAIASLTAVGQLLFVQASPWWSMAMFATSLLVIYGLATYAGSRLRLE